MHNMQYWLFAVVTAISLISNYLAILFYLESRTSGSFPGAVIYSNGNSQLDFGWGSIVHSHLGPRVGNIDVHLDDTRDLILYTDEKFAYKKCSVCLVTFEFEGLTKNGGIGTMYTQLARLLSDQGFNVTVLYYGEMAFDTIGFVAFRDHYHRSTNIYIEHIRPLNVEPSWFHGVSYAIYRWVYKQPQKCQILHFPDNQGIGFASVQAHKMGLIPRANQVVVTLHGSTSWADLLSSVWNNKIMGLETNIMEEIMISSASQVVSPSRYMVQYLSSRGLSFLSPPVVILNPVNPKGIVAHLNSLDEGPIRMRTCPTTLPILEIVFFGRLEARKGLLVMLEALELIAHGDMEENDDVNVQYNGQIEQKLRSANLGKNFTDKYLLERVAVTFLGKATSVGGRSSQSVIDHAHKSGSWSSVPLKIISLGRDDALDYVSNCSRLVVVPSLNDNSPYTVLEALNVGARILASGVGGIPDLFHPDDRKNALFLPVTPWDLAKALIRILINPNQVSNLRPASTVEETNSYWKGLHFKLSDQHAQILNTESVTSSRKMKGRYSVLIKTRVNGHQLQIFEIKRAIYSILMQKCSTVGADPCELHKIFILGWPGDRFHELYVIASSFNLKDILVIVVNAAENGFRKCLEDEVEFQNLNSNSVAHHILVMNGAHALRNSAIQMFLQAIDLTRSLGALSFAEEFDFKYIDTFEGPKKIIDENLEQILKEIPEQYAAELDASKSQWQRKIHCYTGPDPRTILSDPSRITSGTYMLTVQAFALLIPHISQLDNFDWNFLSELTVAYDKRVFEVVPEPLVLIDNKRRGASFSFSDSFNAILPILNEVGQKAPGYVDYIMYTQHFGTVEMLSSVSIADSVRDFSCIPGQMGWSYGFSSQKSVPFQIISPLVYCHENSWFHADGRKSGIPFINKMYVHPLKLGLLELNPIIRYVSPIEGNFELKIEASYKGGCGDGVQLKVTVDGKISNGGVFSFVVAGDAVSDSVSVQLKAGSIIDTIIEAGEDHQCDMLALQIIVNKGTKVVDKDIYQDSDFSQPSVKGILGWTSRGFDSDKSFFEYGFSSYNPETLTQGHCVPENAVFMGNSYKHIDRLDEDAPFIEIGYMQPFLDIFSGKSIQPCIVSRCVDNHGNLKEFGTVFVSATILNAIDDQVVMQIGADGILAKFQIFNSNTNETTVVKTIDVPPNIEIIMQPIQIFLGFGDTFEFIIDPKSSSATDVVSYDLLIRRVF